MGICECLTIIFILLKILNIINWNWFFVLLPEIIAVVLYTIFIISAIRLNRQINKQFNKFWEDK